MHEYDEDKSGQIIHMPPVHCGANGMEGSTVLPYRMGLAADSPPPAQWWFIFVSFSRHTLFALRAQLVMVLLLLLCARVPSDAITHRKLYEWDRESNWRILCCYRTRTYVCVCVCECAY